MDLKGKNGHHTLLGLELEGKELPRTRTNGTANGGQHIIFFVEAAVRQGVNVLGPGLDIRSRGGYIVAPGSIIDGKAYTVLNNAPITSAPQWIVDDCGKPGLRLTEEERTTVPPVLTDDHTRKRTRARAREWLKSQPPAIEGQGGDQRTFDAIAGVRDRGVLKEDASEAMADWNATCEPPWNETDLQVKIENVYRYAQNPIGVDAPEVAFADAPSEGGDRDKELHPYEKLNLDHAFITAAGDAHIVWETTNEDGQETVEHMDIQTLKQKFAPVKMSVGNKSTSVASQWLEWSGRRSYDGFVFVPGQPREVSTDINGRSKKFFNLWRGFAVAPAPVGASHVALALFLEHLRENVCGGNESLYRWLLGYFAHLIQRPGEKPGVALVFRGGKGVGKTIVAEKIGGLLGPHFLLTSNRRYLVGNFNGHLERCLMFALDEAFWSGDKPAEGIVKDLITGNKHVVEHKGREPYTVANKTRVIIIGNENWLVPASHDERRFAFFDVGDGRRQDRVFFGRISDGLRDGGYPVLLRYLMDYDFSGIDVNVAPLTSGLLDQKLQSDDPLMQWWYQCLKEERIVGSEFEGWPESMESERFRSAMKRSAKDRNIQPRLPDVHTFGKRMKPLGVTNTRQRQKGQQDGFIHVYTIPKLAEARQKWDASTGQPTKWDE